MGQILLAKRMGKTRIIAETGAGQHGVATATVAALFNMKCVIFMGELDIERQKPNVFRYSWSFSARTSGPVRDRCAARSDARYGCHLKGNEEMVSFPLPRELSAVS